MMSWAGEAVALPLHVVVGGEVHRKETNPSTQLTMLPCGHECLQEPFFMRGSKI